MKMLQKDKTFKEMDPELLTYVRLSSALDTESTPVVVMAHDPTTQRSLIIDVIAEADKPGVEERLQAIQWSQMVLQYVPMHTWTSLESPPRTFLERVQACQQAAIAHDHLLTSVVEELQRGVGEDDPAWPSDVRDYVHQLRASFCSPVESTDSEESRVLSPVPDDTPHIPATDATTVTDEVAPVPQEIQALPATEEEDEGVPAAAPESKEAPEETESAFVKKNKGKGKSKKH